MENALHVAAKESVKLRNLWMSEQEEAVNPVFMADGITLEPPKSLAKTMLGWLSHDATIASADSKNLFKALDIVKAELQHRTNRLAAASVETGIQCDVLLSFVAIPETVFQEILDFLPRSETVHKACLVCKSWLAVARSPQMWHTLDSAHGLLERSSTVTNMTQLLQLLKKPQFASLQRLASPDRVQARKGAMEQIAKACPLLTEIALGNFTYSQMRIDDATLLKIPQVFPYLTSIQMGLCKATGPGVAAFCQRMGDRLLSIQIRDSCSCRKKLSDETLNTIARSCPNLERFDYQWSPLYSLNPENRDEGHVLSANGIIALLNGCSNLKSLNLLDTNMVGLTAFEHLFSKDCRAHLDRLFVMGHDDLMKDEILCAKLAEHVPFFETKTKREHNDCITVCRHRHQSSMYW